MKVYKPTDNPITRGYSTGHRGYDFSGLNRPDEVRSGKDGTIAERVDDYTTNWTNTGTLTTKDYGNYIKVKHDDGTFALFAHLKKGSSFIKGTRVLAGQTIARIGNTGNSTGPHLHAEYRTAGNINTAVEFYLGEKPEGIPDAQAELNKVIKERDDNHNDRMALYEELGFDGIFVRQRATDEIKRLRSVDKDYINKVNQNETAKENINDLEEQVLKLEKDHNDFASKATETIQGDQRKIQALSQQVADLQKQLKVAELTGFRKFVYNLLIR